MSSLSASLATTAPTPANIMLASDRFIALDISAVRMKPAAPTSEPEIISTLLLSPQPWPAAASPEYALSNEITTGISAPPIGITSLIPSRQETPVNHQYGADDVGHRTSQTLSATQINTSPPLIACRPGSRTGRSSMRLCSLPNATALPVNATPPMRAESAAETVNWMLISSTNPPLSASSNAAPTASAEAPPPNPFRTATTCGMAVMGAR